MSIWHKEVVKVNGRLMAYVETQNEYTGATKGGLREIHVDDNRYFCRADGQRVDVTEDRERCIDYENRCKIALDWYSRTKF